MTRQETNLNELKCQLQVTIEGSEPFTISTFPIKITSGVVKRYADGSLLLTNTTIDTSELGVQLAAAFHRAAEAIKHELSFGEGA